MVYRRPLIVTAVLLILIKSIQFVIDSQALFYNDSGAFIVNAIGGVVPERSYLYGLLIRIFSVSIHSLRAIVVMQMLMGTLTAWLLAFILLRYFYVRPWIAILAAVIFAFDPVQVLHEHLIMTETSAMLAGTLFLLSSLEYLRTRSVSRLVVLSFLGIVLVALRIVYLPVVLACAVILPLGGYFVSPLRKPKALAIALAVSCVSAFLFHAAYRYGIGMLMKREPAYHYKTGDFLVSLVTPLIRPEDTSDPRIVEAIHAQNRTDIPLANPDSRTMQMWDANGFVTRMHAVFQDEAAANMAENQLAHDAIRRNPWAFASLGLHTYAEFWREIPNMPLYLAKENGTPPQPYINPGGVKMVADIYGVDISNQYRLYTPSRRYHLLGRYWNVFLLASPILAALAALLRPLKSHAPTVLLVWSLLLFASTFMGASEVGYRYLHPFSLIGLIASAQLIETAIPKKKNQVAISE